MIERAVLGRGHQPRAGIAGNALLRPLFQRGAEGVVQRFFRGVKVAEQADQRGEDAIANYRKGDTVQAAVTEVDVEKERISLSIKALGEDNFSDAVDGVKRGSVVTVTVTAIEEGGIEVEYNGAKSFIRRSDLSRDRADQRPERFTVGDTIDVRVTNIDPKTRRLGLSIKAREIAEEKEAVEQYGSSDSGASLGDILGAALKGGN